MRVANRWRMEKVVYWKGRHYFFKPLEVKEIPDECRGKFPATLVDLDPPKPKKKLIVEAPKTPVLKVTKPRTARKRGRRKKDES